MASMQIDKDVRDALKAGTITRADAAALMDGRSELRKLDRRIEALRGKLVPLEVQRAAEASDIEDIEALMAGGEAGHDEAE